eukprot:355658-Chlamydomonas_euryale.AAC.13
MSTAGLHMHCIPLVPVVCGWARSLHCSRCDPPCSRCAWLGLQPTFFTLSPWLPSTAGSLAQQCICVSRDSHTTPHHPIST